MKTRYYFTIYLITIVFFSISCTKDNPSDLSASTAKTEISTLKVTYNVETTAMDSTQGMMAYDHLSSLRLPFLIPSQGNLPSASSKRYFSMRTFGYIGEKSSSIQKAFDLRINFQSYVGTYVWNPENHYFDYISTPTDQIIVKFPFPASNTTNNAVYTISKYTINYDAEADETEGDYFANITLDGNEIWSVNYSSSFQMTESMYYFNQTIQIKFPPYEYDQTVELKSTGIESGDALAKVSRVIKKNSQKILSGNCDLSGKYSDSGSYIEMSTKGDFSIMNIRFHFVTSYSGDDGNFDLLNNLMVTVYNAGGAKVGEMKYILNQDQEPELMFFFNNGISVNADILFDYTLDNWYSFMDLMNSNIGGAKK